MKFKGGVTLQRMRKITHSQMHARDTFQIPRHTSVFVGLRRERKTLQLQTYFQLFSVCRRMKYTLGNGQLGIRQRLKVRCSYVKYVPHKSSRSLIKLQYCNCIGAAKSNCSSKWKLLCYNSFRFLRVRF